MKEITLKEFLETCTTKSDVFTGLDLTDTETLPEGWHSLRSGGCFDDSAGYGEWLTVYTTADQKKIVVCRSISEDYGETGSYELTVSVV